MPVCATCHREFRSEQSLGLHLWHVRRTGFHWPRGEYDPFTAPIERVREDLRREGIDTESLKDWARKRLAVLRGCA